MKTKILLTALSLVLAFFIVCNTNAQYTKLLDFAGAANGSYPKGSLISDGIFLYGMTEQGGINYAGTVFKIKPDGSGYSKLLDFYWANGSYPWGSLISDGIFLYGMTSQGGINDEGTIFKIKPDGSGYSKLLDFDWFANGSGPHGSLISDGTFLYGMTPYGGTNDDGVVFKINPVGMGIADLSGNYSTSISIFPNPFSNLATIQYNLPATAQVNFTLYNLYGQRVGEILSSKESAGEHTLTLNAEELNIPNGVYILEMRTGERKQYQKIVCVR